MTDGDTIVHLHPGRFVHPMLREQRFAVPAGFRYSWSHPHLSDPDAGTPRMLAGGDIYRGNPRASVRKFCVRARGAAGHIRTSRAPEVDGAALIHSSQQLLRNSPLPYVLDLEHVQALTAFQRPALRRHFAVRRLGELLRDDRLRWILPWSDTAGRSVLAALPSEYHAEVRSKIRTVYPCVRPAVATPGSCGTGPLTLLFVGAAFLEKGGVEAVDVVRRLRNSYDVRLDLVSFVPPEWHRRVASAPGVTLHRSGITLAALRRLYRRADAFLFPSHMDTYGIVVGEAMAHGLPVIASDQFALPELVEHGVSGLLFRHENSMWGPDYLSRFDYLLPTPAPLLRALAVPSERYLSDFTNAVARLAEDRALCARLAHGALQQVRTGRFSVGRRAALLSDMYRTCLAP